MPNERCEKHNITRCTTCMALERKGTTNHGRDISGKLCPQAPPEITGAPPPDIEQMDSPALRAEKDAYDKAIFHPDPPFDLSRPQPGPAPVTTAPHTDYVALAGFETLPVDDSHASKVMRAASAYATASKDWAQNLARVEKIKSELLKAEALLHEALVAKETSEGDLKTLVTGDVAA